LVVPLPSSPWALAPQHCTAPAPLNAQLWEVPATTIGLAAQAAGGAAEPATNPIKIAVLARNCFNFLSFRFPMQAMGFGPWVDGYGVVAFLSPITLMRYWRNYYLD
jgi:hypothetical protein